MEIIASQRERKLEIRAKRAAASLMGNRSAYLVWEIFVSWVREFMDSGILGVFGALRDLRLSHSETREKQNQFDKSWLFYRTTASTFSHLS